MKTVRECFWIWGHPTNSLYGAFGLQQTSSMSPLEGMFYLGARNVWYVPMGLPVNREQRSKGLSAAHDVGWALEKAAEHPEVVEELRTLAKNHTNITKCIFDDFFNEENTDNHLRYPREKLEALRQQLHTGPNGLEMWLVLYTKQLEEPAVPALLSAFDGVTLWFWNEDDVTHFEERLARFFERTPGQKRMLGCYLYDFGGGRPADPAIVTAQLARARVFLHEKKLDGIILHTNAVADLGLAAPEAARRWLAEHGDEPV